MAHAVLLGDSIFDNGRYVPGRPPVIEQLKSWLGREWTATLLAQDGAIASDVESQLARLPPTASHLVISAGGNDALGASPLLEETAETAASGFATLADVQLQFDTVYNEMLRAVLRARLPTIVCTIYDAVPGLSRAAVSALSVFNDVIVRAAIRRRLAVLDLRSICTEARDYSEISPIEPSEHGGAKIVRGIRRILLHHDFARTETVIYGSD